MRGDVRSPKITALERRSAEPPPSAPRRAPGGAGDNPDKGFAGSSTTPTRRRGRTRWAPTVHLLNKEGDCVKGSAHDMFVA